MKKPTAPPSPLVRRAAASADPEQVLATALQQQETAFAAALAVMAKLSNQASPSGEAAFDLVDRLQDVLQQVISAQGEVQEAQNRFRLSGRQISEELRGVLQKQETGLRTMLEHIQETQASLESARNQLIPGLEQQSRRRSMHAAYQQTMRTM